MNYRLVQQLQQKAIPVQQSCRVLEISIMLPNNVANGLRLPAQLQCVYGVCLKPRGVAMAVGGYAMRSINKVSVSAVIVCVV